MHWRWLALGVVACTTPASMDSTDSGPPPTGVDPIAVAIVTPADGGVVDAQAALGLRAVVASNDAGCCEVRWTSDVDGTLADGAETTGVLATVGLHELTVVATAESGATGEDTVSVEVVWPAPQVTVQSPTEGATYVANESVRLQGLVTSVVEIDDSAVVWTSSEPGDPMPLEGVDGMVRFDTIGARTLTLSATNPSGRVHQDSVQVEVLAPDSDDPGLVVQQPSADAVLYADDDVTLEASLTTNGSGGGVNRQSYGWQIDYLGETYDVGSLELDTVLVPSKVLPGSSAVDVEATLVAWAHDNYGRVYVTVPVVIRWP